MGTKDRNPVLAFSCAGTNTLSNKLRGTCVSTNICKNMWRTLSHSPVGPYMGAWSGLGKVCGRDGWCEV